MGGPGYPAPYKLARLKTRQKGGQRLTALLYLGRIYYMAEQEPQSSSNGQEEERRRMEEFLNKLPLFLKAGLFPFLLAEASLKARKEKESISGKEKSPQEVVREVIESMRGTKIEDLGFGLITNGNLAGAISLALAGWGMKELGEIWKEYGREHFPLDPFTKRGRTAMKKQYQEIKNALAQIGRG